MKTIFSLFILCSSLSLVSSCEEKDDTKAHEVVVSDLAKDFKVPKQIFQEIKDSLGINLKIEPEFLFTDLEVQFFSDQSSVLSYPKVLFKLPKGGGEIDLKDYVTGSGSFYLSFPPEQFEAKPPLEFIFFMSNSTKVKANGEDFGLGCGEWVNLASKFKELQKTKFFKLNSIGHRYVPVITGTYIFVFKKGIQYYLTHVNIFDSRYTDQLCTQIFKTK